MRITKEYQYFHISKRDDLAAIKPSKFDAFGRMPEPAIFVTTSEHIDHWKWYIGEGMTSLHLYGLNPSPDLRIEEGEDGAERGDFKIITSEPLSADFLRRL